MFTLQNLENSFNDYKHLGNATDCPTNEYNNNKINARCSSQKKIFLKSTILWYKTGVGKLYGVEGQKSRLNITRELPTPDVKYLYYRFNRVIASTSDGFDFFKFCVNSFGLPPGAPPSDLTLSVVLQPNEKKQFDPNDVNRLDGLRIFNFNFTAC